MEKNNLILYTDGSFRDRKAGWGFHGYFYTREPMKSKANLKAQPTEYGYKDVSVEETCTPTQYVDSFGPVEKNPTNNTAELKAVIRALEFADKHNVKDLKLFIDSDYVRLGLLEHVKKWIKNNWVNSKGEPVKNQKLWKTLLEEYSKWNNKEKKIELVNVKGHSGDFGNDKADVNALRGIQVESDRFYKTDSIEINKVKKIDISPLILETRLLFSTVEPDNAKLTYYSYNLGRLHAAGISQKHSAKQKLVLSDLLIGRRISEATLSVYKTKEPEDYMDFIKELHVKALGTSEPELVIVDLNNACAARQRQQIESLGLDGLIIHDDIKVISTPELALISRTLNPPRLAYDAIQTFTNLERILDEYLEDRLGNSIKVMDITDLFYKKDKKDNFTLLKSITNQTKHLDFNFELKGTQRYIKIIPSIDIPVRNQLNKIAKIIKCVKLLVNMNGPNTYSYSVIFETEEGSAIYSSPYVQQII